MFTRACRGALLVLVPLAAVPLLVAATHGSTRHLTVLSCGQTITTSTTLSADLGPCGGNGVVIGSDHVTLNLNGHRIRGSDGNVGIVGNHVGVVVENGSVSSFGVDVSLTGDSNRVMNLHVSAGATAGVAVGGQNDVISGNRVFISGVGIDGEGAGSQYTNNVLQGNSDDGLNLGDPALVSGNKALNNGTFGINAFNSIGAPMAVTNNIADGNHVHGIVAGAGFDATVITLSGNKAYFNGNLGISATPGVNDGGNNKADENGTPAQCTSVVCS
jgi:hypothetical protein